MNILLLIGPLISVRRFTCISFWPRQTLAKVIPSKRNQRRRGVGGLARDQKITQEHIYLSCCPWTICIHFSFLWRALFVPCHRHRRLDPVKRGKSQIDWYRSCLTLKLFTLTIPTGLSWNCFQAICIQFITSDFAILCPFHSNWREYVQPTYCQLRASLPTTASYTFL